MAKRPRRRDTVDQGRGYFETTSPFETFEPATDRGEPSTFSGYTDTFDMPRRLMSDTTGEHFVAHMDPEQYDNPRGFPGLALITTGSQTSKLPLAAKDKGHSIMHHMESEGQLASASATRRRKGKR